MRIWALIVLLAPMLAGCAPWKSALPKDPRGHNPPLPDAARTASLSPDAAAAQTPESPVVLETPPVPSGALPVALEAPPPSAPLDPAVARASASDAPNMAMLLAEAGSPATEIAAQVGDTYISTREVKRALAERVRGNDSWGKMSPEQKKMAVRDLLQYMIDRAIVVQAARRELNKPKQWETLKEHVEKTWESTELPSYLKKYNVENEVELERKLAEIGDSLEDVKQAYHLDQISRMFTYEKIRSQITNPGFQEIYPYYRENIAKFQRPAELRFREIFLSIDADHPDSAARGEADAALARLRGGEPFDQVARATSRGTTAEQGGLWTLAPGSYGAVSVNAALERLAVGQSSGILKEPRGYYIVKLESRRPAGPTPFEEVQGTIVAELQQREYERAYNGFVKKMRDQAVVRSPLLDGLGRE